MYHPPDLQTFVQLGAGESRLLQAKAGTCLASSAGALSVTGAPLWLGEQVFRSRTRLAPPGQPYLIEQDGWITLTAGPQGDTVGLMCPQQTLSLVCVLREAGRRLFTPPYIRILRIAGIRRRPANPGSLG
ncbi:hypothetical protein [Polaromonas sp. SM01]|uniref:hypothetical protein n=1 Tax=Polaromonas sp. SM01 TaxID=3085630 RepID=UPI002980FA14|nr:hypothetical protein [Polaromonas sp. SM01]MDW5443492.1 hypothetical protein [Polaromonas sp. SM01]